MSESRAPGQVLTVGVTVGNYQIREKIGEGGMGVVYLAEHPLLGRKVAVKVLLPEHSQRSDLVTRFFNEAKTAAALKHPALVDVFDFGFLADGAAYIVMDFLEGESLASRLQRVAPLPPEQAATIARQIAVGVGAAHAHGIVHRDLKPDNVFLVPDPEDLSRERVKILDFGIAKLLTPEAPGSRGATRTGMVLGTPLFMAPEQCRGSGQVDHRADVYAVGCILFMMLTARPPFDYEGVGELLGAHLHEPVPSPRAINPAIPEGIEALVLKALAKRPEQRHQSMADLAAELRRFSDAPSVASPLREGSSSSGPSPSPSQSRTSAGTAVLAPTTFSGAAASATGEASSLHGRGRGKRLLVLLGVAGVVAAAVLASGLSRGRGPGKGQGRDEISAPATAEPAGPASAGPASADPASADPASAGPASVGPAETASPEAAPTGAALEAHGHPPAVDEPRSDEPSRSPAPAKAAAGSPLSAKLEVPSKTARRNEERADRLLETALAHLARGEEAEALLAFRAVLRQERVRPADRAEAERRMIALQRKFAEVEIQCDLDGAEVQVDGKPAGRTPLHKPLVLRPGSHVLSLRKPGYRPLTRSLSLSAGERLSLRFQLPR